MPNKIELPDYDAISENITKTANLERDCFLLEHDIAMAEAKIVNDVTNLPKYAVNGKAPSMAYVERTYLYTGVEDNTTLLDWRKELGLKRVEVSKLKAENKLYLEWLQVWRTEQANLRSN